TNDSNIFPRKIKWSDINIPEDWSIQSDTITPNQENIENTSLHSNSKNLREKFNYLNICDEKLDKNYQLHPHRSSTSSIISKPSNYFDTKTKFSEISNHSNILKGIYPQNDFQNPQNDSQEIDEPISPTYCEIKPHPQFMMIRINKPFEINKDLIRKDFLQEKSLRKRNRFFTKYSETELNNIQTSWYKYMTKIKAHVMFFDYLKFTLSNRKIKNILKKKNFRKI
ncbi:hypothetical protein CFOL_v3_13844, partial [Cephalotus follicularis]